EPVAALVAARGVAAVPLVACAAGGCWLLVGAAVALPRASAHRAVPPRPANPLTPHDRWDPTAGGSPARPPARPSAISPARATATAVAAPFTCEEHDTR
ncbi:hypothetical protein EBN88_22280, partial [Streptomyces triticirhizae]